MNENWFDKEWEDECEDNSWLEPFWEAMKRDEGNLYVPIPNQIENVRQVYQAMKKLTADQEVEVTFKLFQPFLSCGSVTLEGDDLIFDDPTAFAETARLADNFEIYPLVNGKVRLSFAFNHMVTKIGRIDN